jgi:hypothetical protein
MPQSIHNPYSCDCDRVLHSAQYSSRFR